jgi:hypothetical protein
VLIALLPVFLILVLCLVLSLVRALILALGWCALLRSRTHSPLVNLSEDQIAAHALAFTRGVHGSVLIAFDYRLVTRCATSVAFVCFYHCPGKYVFNRLIGVFVKLHFNFRELKILLPQIGVSLIHRTCALICG